MRESESGFDTGLARFGMTSGRADRWVNDNDDEKHRTLYHNRGVPQEASITPVEARCRPGRA